MQVAIAQLRVLAEEAKRQRIGLRPAMRLDPKDATRCREREWPWRSGAVCGAIMTPCCSASWAMRSASVKPAARVASNCT